VTPLRYNLALTLEEHAIDNFQRYQKERQFGLVPLLCAELEHAVRIFTSLQATAGTYLVCFFFINFDFFFFFQKIQKKI
jgi:hypothetical protein